MKHIAKILAVVLTLTLIASLAACGSSDSGSGSPLVGKWESIEAPGTIYEFKADGTGTLSGEGYSLDLTYTEKDDTVSFTYNGGSEVQTFNYTIKDDVLSIIDPNGTTLTYKKQ